MKTKKTESVIFDWGGVLIDDPEPGLVRYCAAALGVSEEQFRKACNKFEADFRKGAISEDTFWIQLAGELNVSKPAVLSLWGEAFAKVYQPKEDMFLLVSSLQKNGYKTALLSNTEIPAMQYFYQQHYGMFDVLVFSCWEGIKKPDRKIYELALEKLGTRPVEAAFIDDKPACIKGAQEAGLKTILFENIGQVKKSLASLGVQIN
ncbi:MAG: HAD family hydrolase [Planctomycetota bacterium]|jgi:epoxide hydrolase-like predicted phosphatase